MAESSDELERHIRDIRHDLKEDFDQLEDKVKSAVDWRAQFEEHPGTMLALAFSGGVLLSALLPRARSPRKIVLDGNGNAETVGSEPASSARRRRVVYEDEVARGGSAAWSALKGVIIGAAAGKLSEFIEDLFPASGAGSRTGRSGYTYD
jgi:hypothetical protein